MDTIIVASDLSERSDDAVRRGVELALTAGAQLILTHVVDNAMPADMAKDVQTQAQRLLQTTLAGCLHERDLSYKIRVEIGDVAEKINDICQDEHAELLIVGMHRRRIFLDQYRETTLERVIRSSRIPVLMVTKPAQEAYGNMLGAIGLSRACASALQLGRTIAPTADLTLFHAHEVSFRKESERDYATWQAVSVLPPDLPEPIYIEAAPLDAIANLAASKHFDLMTLGAHTRTSLGHFLLGGFTAALIRKPPCDLLIVK